MKYTYSGTNSETGQHKQHAFEDENEAVDFARKNASECPKYRVVDEDGTLIDSDEMAEDEVQTALDNMFPEDESREGFDADKHFESD
jgi:hypothetical protein